MGVIVFDLFLRSHTEMFGSGSARLCRLKIALEQSGNSSQKEMVARFVQDYVPAPGSAPRLKLLPIIIIIIIFMSIN